MIINNFSGKTATIIAKLFTVITLSIFFLSSCSDANSTDNDNEPELIDRYYFEGKLDNEPFLIEQKYYTDFSFNESPYVVDYGGTLINCLDEPEDGVHLNCYTIYASGILVNPFFSEEEQENLNSAKVYFGPIDVDKRIFDNELAELKKFLQNKDITFRRDFGFIENQGAFAFDFFPPSTNENDLLYYSTRFNDNSEYKATITSVEEVDTYFFIIEGAIDSCKL